jgi:hypothetical protein
MFESHEFTNLIETEAEVLRALDEANPVNHGGRVLPHPPCAMWDSQQTPTLVIPYGFHPHLGRESKPPNGNGGIVGTL